MAPHLGLQRIMIPSAQVSSLTTGSITLPSARGAFELGDFESIATAYGDGSSATITLNSIPSTYKHLQIHALYKGTATGSNTQGMLVMRFNSDSGSNYGVLQMSGAGAGQSTVAGITRTGDTGMFNNVNFYYNSICSATNTGSAMAVAVIDVADYANTSFNKNVAFLMGREIGNNDGNSRAQMSAGAWGSTTAISSITFTILDESMSTTNFTSTTGFALYGIKG